MGQMSNGNKNMTEQIIAILKQKSVLRPRDLDAYKIPRRYLSRLQQRGLLVRSARGIYTAANAELSEKQTIVEVSKRIPKGTVCLLSALSIHEITTQSPFEIWLAIDRKGWLPKVKDLPIKTVRFSGEALTSGIDFHTIDGVKVPVYNPAKTIADCFKYRNKIGLDITIEALKEGWKDKKFNMNDIWEYSKICRVQNVIRPYLESLSS